MHVLVRDSTEAENTMGRTDENVDQERVSINLGRLSARRLRRRTAVRPFARARHILTPKRFRRRRVDRSSRRRLGERQTGVSVRLSSAMIRDDNNDIIGGHFFLIMDPSKNFASCLHFSARAFHKTSSRLNARHDDTKKTRLQAQKHHHHHYHRVALFPRPFSRVCRGAQSERVSILRYFIVGAHKCARIF